MKQFFFILILLEVLLSQAQPYFIAFTDKNTSNNNLALSTLSARSVERRLDQEIEIDSLDYPVKTEYINGVVNAGVLVKHTSKWLNGVLVDIPDENIITDISSLSYVKYIHNLSSTSTGGVQETQIDTALYGNTTGASSLLELDYYHNQNLLGSGILLSIFDAGFSGMDTITPFSHVYADERCLDQYNFVNKTNDVYQKNEHGTNVASTILGIDTGIFIGVAPQCEIALYLTENISSETLEEEYNWVLAAERADSIGTDIICSALGYYSFDIDSTSHTFEELDGKTAVISLGAKIASSKGILVVNSSGNSANSNDWPYVVFPADVEEVLTVGSINLQGERSSFSSFGSNTDYVKPDMVAPASKAKIIKANGTYATSSGTSFSAPLLAGYSALLWQQNPHLTSKEVKELIISLGSNGDIPNTETGYGYPILNINGIDEKKSKNTLKTTFYDMNGREISYPNSPGIYISETLYTDQTFSRRKIQIVD